jgi:hypothetical protein
MGEGGWGWGRTVSSMRITRRQSSVSSSFWAMYGSEFLFFFFCSPFVSFATGRIERE